MTRIEDTTDACIINGFKITAGVECTTFLESDDQCEIVDFRSEQFVQVLWNMGQYNNGQPQALKGFFCDLSEFNVRVWVSNISQLEESPPITTSLFSF